MAGLVIGSMILFSNFQFGLQTGWVSMMSLPSALISYAVFRAFPGLTKEFPFTREENVYAQSVAVAVGTGPLAFGMVGIVPAIEKLLTSEENDGQPIFMHIGQLILWSLSLSLFGVFFAVLLRRQVIVREQLKFPSGSATATMISVLHEGEKVRVEQAEDNEDEEQEQEDTSETPSSYPSYNRQVKILKISFAISAACTLIQHFLPILRNLPVFGPWLAKNYLWTFNPSPGYIGQGFIMGLHTTASMLLGCILGWGILAPYSQHKGWAPGPIDDWKTGGQGWILWISLALMVGDSVVSLLVLTYKQIYQYFHAFQDTESSYTSTEAEDVEHEHPEYDISSKFAGIGILLSSLLCLVGIKLVFPQIHLIQIIVSVFIALLLSVLGVRALGETDLNPVSGIGKISQIFLSLIPNSTILSNLVAGAIAEAGAQQAGDLMQDLKTGHLIGAYPKSQFIAQVTGSLFSVLLSGLVYRLYMSVYEIPGSLFRIPTAIIWVDCARLVMGGGLPEKVGTFTAVFGVIGSALAVLRDYAPLLPSGVAIGVGLYNVPSFTLARFLGGVVAYFYQKRKPDAHIDIIVCSSGLILGEGIMSVVTMLLTALTEEHNHG